jgi:hypothetical protein
VTDDRLASAADTIDATFAAMAGEAAAMRADLAGMRTTNGEMLDDLRAAAARHARVLWAMGGRPVDEGGGATIDELLS